MYPVPTLVPPLTKSYPLPLSLLLLDADPFPEMAACSSVSQAALAHSRILTGTAPLDIADSPPSHVRSLPALFQDQAQRNPQAVAFSCRDSSRNGQVATLTYAQGHAVACQIARQLRALHGGRRADDRAPCVAVWLEKGLSLVLAILGTTYSGATWLPFDPDVPVERASVCIADAGASVLLCDAAHAQRAQDVQAVLSKENPDTSSVRIVEFDQLVSSTPSADQDLEFESHPRPTDAAYIIYTSGTTGTPKGIAIPHSAALTFSLSERAVLGTTQQDIVWNGFSPAFDMFVEEMWVTVAGAGHLAIGTREECQDVPGLPAVWVARGVTVVNAVPTLIGIMGIAQADGADSRLLPPCIRLINLGGEACPPALVARLARPGLRIINTYGPTETTVTATWDELEPTRPVTIGRPLPSYHACLLPISEDGGVVSQMPLTLGEGVEGELAIGGPCVGLGYVGRDDLTAQKFIPHPLFVGSDEKLYRTGDRVRLDADLKIVFLGRIDTQVKHRGFRIELGEIESLLSSHPDVQAAAVILTNPGSDEARLEAFIVSPTAGVSVKELAAERLPAYMRPEKVWQIQAEEMPRLPSGKINGKALHALSAQLTAASALAEVGSCTDGDDLSVDPQSGLGILLATLSTVLPAAGRISPSSDFFTDLGGHSLLAAVLVSRLRADPMYTSIGLPDIYEGRTPERIAARFSASPGSATATMISTDDADGTGPLTGEHLPVSQLKYCLCGIAQAISLLFFFFVLSIEILVPYLLFDWLLLHRGIGGAILGAYGVFVATPVALACVAVLGKWLVLGRARAGEYPLYGVYYFRWWLAERFAELSSTKLLADSPLYPSFLRAMGAKIGSHTHLSSMSIGAACDLVEIGDDTVIGTDVVLNVSVVERGRLILKSVKIGAEASVGSSSVVEGGSSVGDGAQLGALSMLADGMHVPDFQRFHGSPARFERDVKEGEAFNGRGSRPSSARWLAMLLGNVVIVTFVLPLLYFVPQLPGLMLFDLVDLRSIGSWAQVAVLSLPIALAYQLLVFVQLIFWRWVMLGRLREGTYKVHSFWYLRKWFVERIMDLALDVLHPVFATLYIVPFLRALGVKIGKRAEVSTARGLQFQLLEIGEESFIADAVLMGDVLVRNNEMTLKKTVLENRAFAGNGSLLPQGTVLPSGSLVGVLSIAPSDVPLEKDSSCFGSPPVLMPSRKREDIGVDVKTLYKPTKGLVASRLVIEGLRIVVPRGLIVFGLGFALQVIYLLYSELGAVYTLLMLPLFYFCFFALPAFLFTLALKWAIVGDYRNKPEMWPLWSYNVWTSEAVTSTWETILEPLLTHLLIGTPMASWVYRAFGTKVGSRATLLSSDVATEYDLVEIGDEAVVNQNSGMQTHLFSDRMMRVGPVKLGNRAVTKPYSIALPGSSINADAQLGSLSLLMKGEELPAGTAWEGAPTKPRANRRRSPYLQGGNATGSSLTFPSKDSQKSMLS
ncbi:unnamed protein product [Parajaminaea phylloscopi]